MDIAIVGFGKEGKSALRYFESRGRITICDQDENVAVPEGVDTRLGPDYLKDLERFDTVVVSPGVPNRKLPEGANLTSVTEEFFKVCKVPIIGVTGTKGKGTTATLIADILETSGKGVHLGGNIGVPALDLLPEIQPRDVAVLELSSFQLADITRSPQTAVVLPVTSDHLDHHESWEDYVEAKANITRFQKQKDVVVFHEQDETASEIATRSKGKKQPYLNTNFAHIRDGQLMYGDEALIKTDEIGLIGPHNLENACAAVTTVWNFTKNREAIHHGLSAFHGLEHRLEFVAEINGVDYYNDSFSAAESAAIAALRSFERPIILIAGGYDKGADFRELAHAVADSTVKCAILIGDNQTKIKQALVDEGFEDYVTTPATRMKEVVEEAKKRSEPGDVVVLSPASASFDMFQNFKQRGLKFKASVLDLT